MSQAGPIDVIASNPQIPTQFPTDDGTAIPLANTLEILGKKTSGDVPVMWTIGSGNTVEIENRTWETAYVVDPSSTVGDRGTFTTIQAAYDAIIADGVATPSQYGVIIVRPGSYAGFTASGTARVLILGLVPILSQQIGQASVSIGNSTINGSSTTVFSNLSIGSVTTAAFSDCRFYNCQIVGITGSGSVRAIGGDIRGVNLSGGNTVDFEDADLVYQSVFTLDSITDLRMNRCYWNGGAFPLTLSGTTNAIITNCERMDLDGGTTGTITVQDTTVTNPINFASAVSIRISGISQADTQLGGNLTELITQVPTTIYPSTEGNIASRRIVTTTGNVTEWDQYVGCRQSGAITLTLTPHTGGFNFFKGQKITIADESGTASANVITVTPSSGTVNGASSVLIGSNYGSMTLIFDGTNWFTSEYEEASGSKTTVYNLVDSGATWNVDPRTKEMEVFIWDGGAGGGSGRKGLTNAAGGGGGGGAGEARYYQGPVSQFPPSALITIGAGGLGGAAQTTDSTNGNPGLPGGATSFGSISGIASNPGAGGTTTTTGFGGAGLGVKTNFFSSNFAGVLISPGNGGNGSTTTSSVQPLNSIAINPTGGGGGGGANSTTERAGQAGGAYVSGTTTLLAGGTAGLESTGINGGNGNSPTGLFPTGSATGLLSAGTGGGGGGGYSVGAGGATTGGNGGNGAVPGGGGGGGGGGLNSVADSGAGGNGGDGRIVVIEYF